MTKSKFRNHQNVRYTRQLFVELDQSPDKCKALYSLSRIDKERHGKKFKSIYKAYMQENDPLEHEFALKYFEDWYHWQDIANSNWMKPLIEEWREELELRIQSDGLKIIQAEAEAGTKYSYAAAQYLAKKGWKEKAVEKKPEATKGRGRPSKAQVLEQANLMAMQELDVLDDIKRLGLENDN